MNQNAAQSPTPSATSSYGARRVAALPRRKLEEILVCGQTPDGKNLAGWEYRGQNTPAFARLLGIRKFIKGFYKNSTGELYGYNVPAKQNDLEEPWQGKPSNSSPRRFGFYRVDQVDPSSRDNAFLQALLLDYGRGNNSVADPTRTLRDYIVRVSPDSDDLLLGKAYVALGPLRVPVSYFVLERHRPSTFVRDS